MKNKKDKKIISSNLVLKDSFKKPSTKAKKKKECPYDDWACRVYGWCATQKCECRREKLRMAF